MSDSNSTAAVGNDKRTKRSKPAKPYPTFPLTPHPAGSWCKKIDGKLVYFGPWNDPDGALLKYQALMGEAESTTRKQRTGGKPSKPYPEFPLTRHPAGYWCKKIRGKIHYFGRLDDPDAALDSYNRQKDALHEGRKPRDADDDAELTVKRLCNLFLNHKDTLVESGELSPRTRTDYGHAAEVIIAEFGKGRLVVDIGPDDFGTLRKKLAAKWGPIRTGNVIQRIRSVFKFGFDGGLIASPLRYGQEFKRPSKKSIRLDRAKQGPRLFTAKEIRDMLGDAGPQLRAMILLGINAGMGNSDCGNLPLSAVDLDSSWIDYPRPKTGVPRRCALWPETVEAIRTALKKRGNVAAEAAGLVFVTKYGKSWAKDVADSPITKETRKLLDKLKINSHRNFYTLRHTFRTVADESKDQPAVDFVMGHESAHMSSVYRETISNERLKAVADHVRGWLFGKPAAKKANASKERPRLRIANAT